MASHASCLPLLNRTNVAQPEKEVKAGKALVGFGFQASLGSSPTCCLLLPANGLPKTFLQKSQPI